MFLMAFEDSQDEKSKTIIDSSTNSTHICIQKGKTALVMVGRLGGGDFKDYTLLIENIQCNPRDKNSSKSADEEHCKRLDLIFVIDVAGSMSDDSQNRENPAITHIQNCVISRYSGER